tara:strand:+ start:562 stop:717 length:156 start_codon:yes stop_codon:yes gene_type:complete
MGRKLGDGKRVTKKTKQKDKYNKFGKNTTKHIRINQENTKINFKQKKIERK